MHATHRTLVDLADLGLDTMSCKALLLLPLVRVAWADGAVEQREREAIVAFGRNHGFLTPAGEAAVEAWLADPPSRAGFERGFDLLVRLAWADEGPGSEITVAQVELAVDYCTVLGLASGAFLRRADALSGPDQKAADEVQETMARLHQAHGPEGGVVGRPLSEDWQALLAELTTRLPRRSSLAS